MGILSKIAGKHEADEPERSDVQLEENHECPHTALVQRWEHPDDMGRKEFATYVCEACGATFSYEEATALLEHPSVGAIEEN